MSPTIQEVVDYIFEIAPNDPGAYENLYQTGSGEAPLRGIGVAWWIDSAMLEDFAARGVNFGISHESVFYELPATYRWGKMSPQNELIANRNIADLAEKHGITIHRFHSNIDFAPWGMPHALIDQLGWTEYPADWSRGVPVVTVPATTLDGLIRELRVKLGLPFVLYDGDPRRAITRVALAWGGLCQSAAGPACAAPLGFDVLVGGDIVDGIVRMARESGWAVVDALHHSTEMEAMRRLAAKLSTRFPGVEVHFRENSMPWSVYCNG